MTAIDSADTSETVEKDAAADDALVPLWAAVLIAAASGGAMALAYPGAALWLLAFPAVALLLISLIGRRVGGALLVGAVFGLVFSFLLYSWAGRYLGPIPWAALSGLEGALTALATIPVTLAYRWFPRLFRRSAVRPLVVSTAVAALWTGRELFLGSWPYGGLPWARIAYVLSDTPAARISSWVGVTGLSFLMVFLVALCVEPLRERTRPGWRSGIAPAIIVVILAFAPAFPTASPGTLRIGAVQGNGPAGYFDVREPLAVLGAQTATTTPILDERMDLLVWPEGGVDADPFQNGTAARTLTRLADRLGAPVLANAATGDDQKFYNTSFLWPVDAPAGMTRGDVQTHAKRHPVPFGEYVPDRPFFNAIVPDLIGLIQREYAPGDDPPVVKVGERTVGLAICFDVIYDEVIREGIGAGADVLVFQTNNADFRGTVENLQQLGIARMRAVETGRSVVNISTVGTSQVIRPDGSTQAAMHADRPGTMLEEVELRTGATAGVMIGPALEQILLWGGLLAIVSAGVLARTRRA
ncbi:MULTISPECIES: apolipoprotein N-acyltransferase [Bacteria]|uniref:apolipoprotein N-acyltransferase n=1 Tax=Bacteria TaxID=2 RepID=UPI003C7B7590